MNRGNRKTRKFMKRRNFLPFLTVFPVLPLCSIGYFNEILKNLINESNISSDLKNKNTLPFTMKELLIKQPTDLIEKNPYYLLKMNKMYLDNVETIRKANKRFKKIKTMKGNIVIIGAFHYKIASLIKGIYKNVNCVGFDSFETGNKIKSIEFGWNNILINWIDNPRLKLSSFNFFKKTLIPGGYLIENPINQLPKDLNTNGLKLIKTSKLATTWKKI